MSAQYKKVEIAENVIIAPGVYSMKIQCADSINPGQFYMIGFVDNAPLLSRPISVCNSDNGYIEFCFIVSGVGTKKLAALKPGDEIFITGPLGNGFIIPPSCKKIALVSGGIGLAPFVGLQKKLSDKQVDYYFGFSSDAYLLDRFNGMSINVSTENGSAGYKGYITDMLDTAGYDLVIACGPLAFLKTVVSKCRHTGTPSLISMEQHMACGIGACLVCVCKTLTGNKRVCADGPVFKGEELIL